MNAQSVKENQHLRFMVSRNKIWETINTCDIHFYSSKRFNGIIETIRHLLAAFKNLKLDQVINFMYNNKKLYIL